MIYYRLLPLIVCAGCIGTADSIMTIRGRLIDKNALPVNGCTAQPFVAGQSEPFSKYERSVDSRFAVTLVNAPSTASFTLEFRCGDKSVPVRTQEVRLKDARSESIDIGDVVIP